MKLYHCWVAGESETVFKQLENISYNQLVVLLCEEGTSIELKGTFDNVLYIDHDPRTVIMWKHNALFVWF